MSNPPKSLAAKMAAIMNDVPTMIRNGQNQQQKYLYVTAEDVKASIRPLMSKHKVAMFANMLDVQRETSINKNQTLVVTVIAKMCFTLVCGETGEQMECIWFGEANDYADKAVNKAATAAEKYFLINTFLLSTTEPDADEVTIDSPPPAQVAPITADQYAAINALGKSLYVREWADEARELVHRFTDGQTRKASELTEAQAAAMYTHLQKEHAKLSGEAAQLSPEEMPI